MSSLIVFGFFCVSDGCRVPSLKPGSTSNSCYTCYNAAIHSSVGASLRTQIVIEGSPADVVLPDRSVAFVVAKAYLPSAATCEQGLLDAFHFVPLPRDPMSDVYEYLLPQWRVPSVIGLGHINSSFAVHAEGDNGIALVTCSDYVWDGKMTSKLICSFDEKLLPTYCISSLPCNSLIQFFGLIKNVASSGSMTVDVKSIVTDVDQLCTLGKRSHSATTEPSLSVTHPSTSAVRSMCGHVTHPSPRITHPLRGVGLQLHHTADDVDSEVNSPQEEARFFLP
ncbi:hypothetical protein EDD15DRAFT_2280504 [Pisolithus albus]|nr:hypothetical protein EDD15DRAFT_2280504 [Pisolithus albus]